jgi:hypothetical protein
MRSGRVIQVEKWEVLKNKKKREKSIKKEKK